MGQLKGFELFGFNLRSENDSQYQGDCPFCSGRKDRFFISKETFLWDCKKCGRSGNFSQFLEQIHSLHQNQITPEQISKLSKDRGISPQTLRAWGIGWAGYFYTWPARGNPGKVVSDLRRYTIGKKVVATAGAKLSLIIPLSVYESEKVWILEGDWDGMALYECLRRLKIKEDVYACPGAGVLPKRLFELFSGKEIITIYDNDGPGIRGVERLAEGLAGICKDFKAVRWPVDYPEGFDFRDLYHSYKRDAKQTLEIVEKLLRVPPQAKASIIVMPKGEGLTSTKVKEVFGKWLYLKNYEPLDVTFGSLFANRLDGDPLWLFLVAPPGGSKTEILMSTSQAPLIYTTTSLTPHALISGMNFGGRDPSLIPKLDKKVLVIKDFTTILSMNSLARDEIFGVLRDAYDGQIQKQFGNGIIRAYKSKFGIIAGVTPVIESLHALNTSLGERFLKYRIKHGGGREAVKRALANVSQSDLMREELAEVSTRALDFEVKSIPELPEEYQDKIILLAEWIANLRGIVSRERYTGQVNFKPMAEIGTRLAKQLSKLAFGISIFKREDVVGKETYHTILSVGRDTIPDRVEEVLKQLFEHGGEGRTKQLADWTQLPEGTLRFLLQDLELLKIIRSEGHYWKIRKEIEELMMELELYKLRRRRKK